MGALDLVVDRLADVVQQPGPLGLFDVEAQLCGHDAAEEGNLQGVLQYVLAVAGAVLQLADQLEQLRVDPVDAQVEGGLLPGLLDVHLHSWVTFSTTSSMRPGWIRPSAMSRSR